MKPAVAFLLIAACADSTTGPVACEDGNAPVMITGGELTQHFLRLDTMYSGGCDAHAFELRWSGLFGASDPLYAPLALHHVTDDVCETRMTEALWFDVTPFSELRGTATALQVSISTSQQPAGVAGYSATLAWPSDDAAAPASAPPLETSCDLP